MSTHPVTFRWKNGGNHVLVTGSFSNWMAIPLQKEDNYSHSITLRLKAGTHLYKYIADGHWHYDFQEKAVLDTRGTSYNNVIVVEASRPAKKAVGERIKAVAPRRFVANHGLVHPVNSIIANYFVQNDQFSWNKNDKEEQEIELIFSDGEKLRGDLSIAKYISLLKPDIGIYGEDVKESKEVDLWAEYSSKIQSCTEFQLAQVLEHLNSHLKLRTYFVGHNITLADIAVWFGLKCTHNLWGDIESSNRSLKYKSLVRWFRYISAIPIFVQMKDFIPKIQQTQSSGSFEELPGAVNGKVRVRFPPEPSGFLHLGHAKAAFLNEYYAKKYEGELIVRFDDTNPSKEKVEYEEAILQDLQRLGIKHDKVSHTSDYFDQILQKAEDLIKVHKAFCDDLSDEQVKELRDIKKELKPSPNRDNTVEKNLQMWEEMKKGSEIGKTYTLRAKIDYKSENGTMRDPVIYRYVDFPHNRTQTKFKIYPIYNFSCPIVDSIEGITHAMRSNEYHSSEEQYFWFIKNVPGLNEVYIKDFARVNFTYTLLSKRKLNHFVENNLVDSWGDPRFPTIQGVLRRGLTVDALKKYILSQGDSKRNVSMDIHELWAKNKQLIDPIIPRYFAVRKEKIVSVELDGPDAPQTVEVLKHRKFPDLGKKQITRCKSIFIEQEDAVSLSVNEEVTLMDWGNAIITEIHKEHDLVKSVKAKLHSSGNVKDTKKKLTWLPNHPSVKLVDILMIEYDTLITEKSIPKGEKEWANKFVNVHTKFETLAYADPNVKNLKQYDQFQFERLGYFILDSDPSAPILHFIQTPDGHTKNKFLSKKVTERH